MATLSDECAPNDNVNVLIDKYKNETHKFKRYVLEQCDEQHGDANAFA